MTILQANTNAAGTTTNPSKQWTNEAGPIQTKRISKAIKKIRWEATGIKERTGTVGGEEVIRGVNILLGKTTNPRALEIIAEIGDRYDWTITRDNQKAILTDCQSGLVEAREAVPVHDLRKTPEQVQEQNQKHKDTNQEHIEQEQKTQEANAKILAKRQAYATALIIAELHHDTSNIVTDYNGHTISRTVAIGWRTGSRESFPQLRKAAACFPETEHMGPGRDNWKLSAMFKYDDTSEEWAKECYRAADHKDKRYGGWLDPHQSRDIPDSFQTEQDAKQWAEQYPAKPGTEYRYSKERYEHRENWSMGGGNYLMDGYKDSSGWCVKSLSLGEDGKFYGYNYTAIEDALPDRTASTGADRQTLAGVTIEKHFHKKKQFDFYIVILPEQVERSEFDRLRTEAKAVGGWYSRKWGKTPGGFAFEDLETAEQFVKDQWGGSDTRPEPDGLGPEPGTKQPWEMTKLDVGTQNVTSPFPGAKGPFKWTNLKGETNYVQTEEKLFKLRSADFKLHKQLVQKALSEGKPIPSEVLKDYPELDRLEPSSNANCSRDYTNEKLEMLAENMQEDIDYKRADLTQNPTPRRLRIKKHQREDADFMERTQDGLRAIAQALRENCLPGVLAGLDTKSSIDKVLNSGILTPIQHQQMDCLDDLMLKYRTQESIDAENERAERDRLEELENSVRFQKIPGFFPTPPKVAERMIELAEIEPHQSVLEPSAGIGHLAQAVKDSCPNAFLFVCEIASKLREILKVKGFTSASKIHYNCLDLTGQFDRVLMNPPFEKKQDETHIKAMFDRLKPGGRLVAVASVGHFHDSKRDTDGLLDFVEYFGYWEKLLDGSFNRCDTFKNTGVNCVLVVLNK